MFNNVEELTIEQIKEILNICVEIKIEKECRKNIDYVRELVDEMNQITYQIAYVTRFKKVEIRMNFSSPSYFDKTPTFKRCNFTEEDIDYIIGYEQRYFNSDFMISVSSDNIPNVVKDEMNKLKIKINSFYEKYRKLSNEDKELFEKLMHQ